MTALTSLGSRPASASAPSAASIVTLRDVSPSSTRAWLRVGDAGDDDIMEGVIGHGRTLAMRLGCRLRSVQRVHIPLHAPTREQGQSRLLLLHGDHRPGGAPCVQRVAPARPHARAVPDARASCTGSAGCRRRRAGRRAPSTTSCSGAGALHDAVPHDRSGRRDAAGVHGPRPAAARRSAASISKRRACMSGPLQWLDAHAAPRVLVSAESLPYRPNRGVYVFVEEPKADAGVRTSSTPGSARLARDRRRTVGRGSGCGRRVVVRHEPTVAQCGAWSTGHRRITVCYLDDDPLRWPGSRHRCSRTRWHDAPVTPVHAGPFETVVPYQWDWFD